MKSTNISYVLTAVAKWFEQSPEE